jgi:hypothetical protein
MKLCKTYGNTNLHCLGGGGGCGVSWPPVIVKIAPLYEFDENDRFFSTSCDSYMGHILRIFTHFTIKRTQRMAFEKHA